MGEPKIKDKRWSVDLEKRIQKIIETSPSQKVIEYDISTEKMKNLPHTLINRNLLKSIA